MRISILFTIVFTCLTFSSNAGAEYQWGFGNVSYNRLDWTKGTEDKSTKTDFNFLELEGGAQFNWGELYGFFDYENPGLPAQDIRTSSKGSIRYNLGKSKLSIYSHVYNFNSHGFSEQNRILGFGYQLEGKNWWFKPFLGVHEVTQTYFSGSNGFMGGWVLFYLLKIKHREFLFLNWHEYEFVRHQNYALGNGNKRDSHNGAYSLWYNLAPKIALGLQWRYAINKLGTAGSSGAAIYTIKYNF